MIKNFKEFINEDIEQDELEDQYGYLHSDEHGLQNDVENLYHMDEEDEESEDDWLMENIQTYEGFWSGSNIHLPWKGSHDDIAKSLLNSFKFDFNYDNLTHSNNAIFEDKFYYNHNGMDLVIRKVKGFRETNYILKVDGDEKDVGYYLAKKLYKFVVKQWQKKLDEEDRNDTHRIMTNI